MPVAQISPIFRINGGAPGAKASVSASSTITATLDSVAGVTTCLWEVVSTDETTNVGDYTLVTSGARHETVTFTAGAAGTAGILQCTVNGGVDPQTGSVSAAMTATAKWFVPTSGGLEVGAAFETFQSSSTFGSTGELNAAIRNSGGGGTVTSVGAAAPITSTGGTTPTIGISAATDLAPGSMSASDKAKLDAADSSPVADTLVLWDGFTDLYARDFSGRGLVITDRGIKVASFVATTPVYTVLASATNYVPDGSVAACFDLKLTASGSTVGTPVNFSDGSDIDILIEQGVGAPYTMPGANGGFSSLYIFPTGITVGLIGSSANDVDHYRFRLRNNYWFCLMHTKHVRP